MRSRWLRWLIKGGILTVFTAVISVVLLPILYTAMSLSPIIAIIVVAVIYLGSFIMLGYMSEKVGSLWIPKRVLWKTRRYILFHSRNKDL